MPRGAAPGERRGGREAGTPNKATADLKAFAGQYTQEAVESMVAIARDAETPPQAKVAAWREILDRGHGKPAQSVTVDGDAVTQPVAVTFVIQKQPGSDNQT